MVTTPQSPAVRDLQGGAQASHRQGCSRLSADAHTGGQNGAAALALRVVGEEMI
jgi:hypothetical protein